MWQPESVVLEVSNHGPPIPPEVKSHLFDPFRRGKPPGRDGGLGLGLFIVERIVTAHGGKVYADSTDAGTTFTVTVPRGAPHDRR